MWKTIVLLCIVLLQCNTSYGIEKDICRYKPANIRVSGANLFVDDAEFYVRGVGYSPTPPRSDIASDAPYGDYYLKEYEGMWERDLARLRLMGANVVRVWTWFFAQPHTLFLDALVEDEKQPIRVLLPFMLSPDLYEDLADPATRRQIMVDFESFLFKYADHPAVLAILIGNELDVAYSKQLDSLFSLINSMVNLAQKMGVQQPLTTPLSAANFIDILSRYYAGSRLPMWSIQAYDPDSMRVIIDAFTDVSASNPKPLLVTEFGASAKLEVPGQDPVLNERHQADVLAGLWGLIEDNDAVTVGGCIMEWVDEWWKGNNFPDFAHDNCPDPRPDIQSDCGVRLSNNTFIHEEWLGLNSQSLPASTISNTEYCITARQAYERMRSIWTGTGEAPPGTRVCATLSEKSPVFYVLIPLGIIIAIFVIIFLVSKFRSKKKTRPDKQRYSLSDEGGQYVPQHRPMVNAHNVLEMLTEAAFLMYTSSKGSARLREFFSRCQSAPQLDITGLNNLLEEYNRASTNDSINGSDPEGFHGTGVRNIYFVNEAVVPSTFRTAQRRIVHLIWDKVLASKEAVGVVPFNIDGSMKRQSEIVLDMVGEGMGGLDDADDDALDAQGQAALKRASAQYGLGRSGQPSGPRPNGPRNLRAFELALLSQNVRLIYHRYLEGYHLWRESKSNIFDNKNIPGREDFGKDNDAAHWTMMLSDLALWNVVSQCSGTIAHSPEKVCEVYHYAQCWLAEPHKHPEYHAAWRRTVTLSAGDLLTNLPINNSDIEDAFMSDNPATEVWTHFNVPAASKIVPTLTVTYHIAGHADLPPPLPSATPSPVAHEQPGTYTVEEPLTFEVHDNVCYIYRKTLALAMQYTGDGLLVRSLMQLFRQYYYDVATHEVNYDDVNDDAFGSSISSKIRRKLNARHKPTGSVDPTWMPMTEEYFRNRRIHRGDLIKTKKNKDTGTGAAVASTSNSNSSKHDGKQPLVTPVSFPQRGGIFSVLVNYGWLMRINLWFILIVWYFLQSEQGLTCVASALPYLALADAALMILVNGLEYSVTKSISPINLVLLAYYVLWFLVVLAAEGFLSFIPTIQGVRILTMGHVNIPVTAASVYVLATVVLVLIGEIFVSLRRSPFAVAGRQSKGRLERQVWAGFWVGVALAIVLGIVLWLVLAKLSPAAWGILGYNFVLVNHVFGVNFSLLALITCILALVLGTGLGAAWGRLRLKCIKMGRSEKSKRAESVSDEVRYILLTVAFWVLTFALYWVVLYQVLITSVVGVTSRTCSCNESTILYSQGQVDACSPRVYIICMLGVALTWVSVITISFVAMYMCFTIVFLGYGLALAATNQVGSVKVWGDIGKFFDRIQSKCFPVMSRSLMFTKNQELVWNHFLDSLHAEYLLTAAERDRLHFGRNVTTAGSFKTFPDFTKTVKSKEALRRIVQFCWSCEAMLKQSKRMSIPEYRRWFQVRTMPSWTVMVPCYAEPAFYTIADLQRPSDKPRISAIEYLAATYPDEWDNFASSLRARLGGGASARSGSELLHRFLNTPTAANSKGESSSSSSSSAPNREVCSPEEVDEVCYWASMRGQTLVRTLRGLMNYRSALERMARMEEGVEYIKDEDEKRKRCMDTRELVRRKFQIILAYQIYNPDRFDRLWTPERQAAFEKMLQRVWGFDLVYNHPNNHQSCMIRFDRVVGDDELDPLVYDDEGRGDVMVTGQWVINRPGQLVIGEPKAENQAHALPFAMGEVLQVNDMNMYNSLEDSFKIPFLMNTFFAAPDDWREPSSVIPPFRIVGFPEHTYTRPLSMVGELMGAAEFCFVTITQRVLASLRVRMHYGHPDFIDGFWARTRGGVSKASHLVNTNEDIFTGYEMLGRDERGTYVDWLSQEKGRETSFMEAFTFEAKLAQGAAQQIRSRHLFYLNKRLPILVKLSLFFGSIGFYLMTLLTTFSIKLYVYSLLMFVGSGVSYHRLGLLGSVIAVPWLFQVGFVQALPLLLEYIIHYGLVTGTLAFLAQLPFGLVFFVFHLKTKAHYFAQGLFSAQGGYKGTGRGFGLDRRGMVEVYKAYFHSHFQDALILIAAVIVYSIISDETSGAIFLRLASIILVIFSWLMAPVLFNPYPTRDSLYEDIRSMRDWLQTKMHKGVDFRTANEGDASGPKSETERKAQVATWWNKQEEMSWQAWFVRNTYVDVWETADRWYSTPLNGVIWYAQQVLFLCWRYLPWIFLFQIYWRLDSVYYAVLAVVVFLLIKSLEFLFASMHEYFTLMKIIPLLLIPPILVFYHYGRMTAFQLLLSMLVYILGIFVLIEVSLGVWNILVKFGTFRDRKSGKWVAGSKGRKYLKRRLQVPRAMFHPQIIWPYLTMGVLAIGNFLTVAISGSLTAVLYNGRVSDMWNRAYMHHRLG